MRPILVLFVLILMVFLNEIETSHLPRLNLGSSSYSEEDLRRIAPLGTSRLGAIPPTRNLMPQPQPSAWYDALNLDQPYRAGPNPDTSLQLGLPGSGKKKKKKRTSHKQFQEPELDNNPLFQFANDVEHLDQMLSTPEGSNYGNYHPQTYYQSGDYYGLPHDSTYMDPSQSSGSVNHRHSLFQATQRGPPEDPYQRAHPTTSRSRKQH